MRTGALFAPLSREGGLAVNNLFLMAANATVFRLTFNDARNANPEDLSPITDEEIVETGLVD